MTPTWTELGTAVGFTGLAHRTRELYALVRVSKNGDPSERALLVARDRCTGYNRVYSGPTSGDHMRGIEGFVLEKRRGRGKNYD